MKTVRFPIGEVIFRQDDPSDCMYEIRSGRVGIYLDYEGENQKKIAELTADQFLGEMGMIEDVPRSATAVALSDGTALMKIDDAELGEYFLDRPEQLLQLMKQLSSRIRERTVQYYDTCRALAAAVAAEKSGTEKDESLKNELEEISKTAEKTANKKRYNPAVNTALFRYVLQDLEETEGNRELTKASLVERLTVRHLELKQIHVNPDDEFTDPNIGPSDRIISEYMDLIQVLQFQKADIFEEPILVNKMKAGGYMLLNGHHRWAAALQRGLSKIHVSIMNPD